MSTASPLSETNIGIRVPDTYAQIRTACDGGEARKVGRAAGAEPVATTLFGEEA
jgi:hypothetical protein